MSTRTYKVTPPAWRSTFLALLAAGISVNEAARRSGVHRVTAYEAARRHPDFAEAWQRALAERERHLRSVSNILTKV